MIQFFQQQRTSVMFSSLISHRKMEGKILKKMIIMALRLWTVFKLSQQSVGNNGCKNKQKDSNEDKSSATDNASCQQSVNHSHQKHDNHDHQMISDDD